MSLTIVNWKLHTILLKIFLELVFDFDVNYE